MISLHGFPQIDGTCSAITILVLLYNFLKFLLKLMILIIFVAPVVPHQNQMKLCTKLSFLRPYYVFHARHYIRSANGIGIPKSKK